MPVVFALAFLIRPRRNNCRRAGFSDCLDKLLRIVTFVGNESFKNQTGNQIIGLPMVALLAARQDEPERVAERVGRQMNFGGKAAATSA